MEPGIQGRGERGHHLVLQALWSAKTEALSCQELPWGAASWIWCWALQISGLRGWFWFFTRPLSINQNQRQKLATGGANSHKPDTGMTSIHQYMSPLLRIKDSSNTKFYNKPAELHPDLVIDNQWIIWLFCRWIKGLFLCCQEETPSKLTFLTWYNQVAQIGEVLVWLTGHNHCLLSLAKASCVNCVCTIRTAVRRHSAPLSSMTSLCSTFLPPGQTVD